MKKIVFLLCLVTGISEAQITLETEYLGRSPYRFDKGNETERVGNSSGKATVYQGSFNMPLKMEVNEQNQSTFWMISPSTSVVKLDNQNFTEDLVVDELMNIGVNLVHQRPLNEKWSLLAALGGGIYTPSTQFSHIKTRHIMGNAAAVFIRHLKPNLEFGGGLALNNTFGYPMVFPALYFKWVTDGDFAVQVQVLEGVDASVSYKINDYLTLGLQAEVKGQMALLKQDGKDKIFSHQYIVTGLQPEFTLGENVKIPLVFGIQAIRPAEITDRSLKTLFQDKGYYFDSALYISAGIKMGF